MGLYYIGNFVPPSHLINIFHTERYLIFFNSHLVDTKGNQPWIFIGRTGTEAEAPILWPPDAKSQLIGKDPDAGEDWGQWKMGAAEDEMVGWFHWVSEHEFELTPGDSEWQRSLACCSLWGHKELDMT